MGRLFRRFFLSFWLAQVATSLAVGVSVWVLRPSAQLSVPALMQPPVHDPSLFPLVMPVVIGGLVSLAFAATIASSVTRPIRRIDQAFAAIAGGRLDERIGSALGAPTNELTALSAGFDQMAARLQALVDSHRRLLHDVSHELRAPLARVQACADLMDRSPERRVELTTRLHGEIERMSALVDELLALARLEVGSASDHREALAVSDLLEAIADDARFDAEQKRCSVSVVCDPDLEVHANPELLHRAIGNVVRNAVRHAPERSRIALCGTREADRAIIDVTDEGPGVADAELPTLFEPFVRGTRAEGDGHGLGLAITRRAIEAHGGMVSASNLAGGGFRVGMSLPLA